MKKTFRVTKLDTATLTLLLCAAIKIFIDNLLVRIHFIIVMIRWTGLAPWEFEFLFPGSLTSTFLTLMLCGAIKVTP